MKSGYRQTCSYTCGATLFRQNLKVDKEKFDSFSKKVSINQTRIWKEREETGEKDIIISKVKDSIRQLIDGMTKEERKERFGWMNHITDEEKELKVKEILEKTFILFWTTASPKMKQKIYDKRLQTRIENGWAIDKSNYTEWENYWREVRYLTEIVYNENKNFINPEDLPRGRGSKFYHIDHKVSILDGFRNNIPPEVIASVYNLEMLLGYDNNLKNSRSSMCIKDLMEKCQDDE